MSEMLERASTTDPLLALEGHAAVPRLRVDLAVDRVAAPPGETVEIQLQVLNTSDVIETLHVSLLSLMAESVTLSPAGVTLFPQESAQVKLELRFHRTLPAGEHEGLVVVAASSGRVAPAEVPVTVEVPATAAASLTPEPRLRTAGRKGVFDFLVANEGNTPLALQFRVADADRQLALEAGTTTLNLRVDETDVVQVLARGRRPWTGAPREHVITVDVLGDGIEEATEVRFRQKPWLTAGVITILTLALIVALWALAMVFGVQAALGPTPPTKMLPETFVEGVGLADLDPAVVGGSVAGTITAATTGKPVARATVEAFDQRGRMVGATATGDDGTYVLDGLLPVRHRLRVRATGFVEQWWPGAGAAGGATPVLVSSDAPAEGIDTSLVGLPGSLGGQAIAGDGEVVPITVEVVAADVADGAAVRTTVADDQGVWSVGDLAAPATYRVTYRAPGYAPVEISQPLDAGQQLVVNTTRLPAATGAISGLVVDQDGEPVGGVEILAQQGATTLDFTTPTSGDVGFFVLEDLETPATYLLTLTAEGFASETRAVRLGPGEAVDLEFVLGPATGTVSGQALSASGSPLGGVTVTVSGGGVVLSSETLTSGDIGHFRVSGLPLPGVYAVTFDLEGYARETVRVELGGSDPSARADVRMAPSLGALTGRVVDAAGRGIPAATIEVSDGTTVRSTTTASVPEGAIGSFTMGGLAPGSYTVTAVTPDGRSITVLETVDAASTTEVVLPVGGT